MARAARCVTGAGALLLILLAFPSTAGAQLVQSVTFGGGYFWPKGYDGRVQGDVLVANLSQPGIPGLICTDEVTGLPRECTPSLLFDIGDFGAWTAFGEWNIAFNRYIEASAGLGFYQQTVNSRYRDLVNREAGDTDILQDLRLQQIPITGLVRFVFGEPGKIQPYVGAGLSMIRFHYSEEGDFVDPSDLTIFCAGTPGCPDPRFESSGFAFGPLLAGGIRLPIGGDIYAFTAEGRYQWASGDLKRDCDNPSDLTKCYVDGATHIDLGGFTFNMGLMIRF